MRVKMGKAGNDGLRIVKRNPEMEQMDYTKPVIWSSTQGTVIVGDIGGVVPVHVWSKGSLLHPPIKWVIQIGKKDYKVMSNSADAIKRVERKWKWYCEQWLKQVEDGGGFTYKENRVLTSDSSYVVEHGLWIGIHPDGYFVKKDRVKRGESHYEFHKLGYRVRIGHPRRGIEKKGFESYQDAKRWVIDGRMIKRIEKRLRMFWYE